MKYLSCCFVLVLFGTNTFAESPETASNRGLDRTEPTAITETGDPGLFVGEHWGMRAFSCKIPNGKYVANLYFAETFVGITGPGQRVFSFTVQGREFRDFDIWEKAGGFRRAYVETVPVEVVDGEFRIVFTAKSEYPAINAIEIVPRAKDATDEASSATTIRIKAGRSTPFTDSSGQIWQPDSGFEGGRSSQASWASERNRRNRGPGWNRGPGNNRGPGDLAQSLLKYDTDDTGGVGLAELPTSLQSLFAELDIDNNGEIDLGEIGALEMLLQAAPDRQPLRDALVSDDPPTLQVVQRLQEIIELSKMTKIANEAQAASVKRSEWLSYAFTVGAMLIGVISFGHLLTTPPPSGSRWTQTDSSPTAIRPVLVSLGLIGILSLIDLFWTTIRSGSFHFQEMNPLGSQLLIYGNSPLVFKITTLAVSILLLFVLRRYRGAQLASWWMCMVCTLLTFRWIILDSAMLS